MPSLPPEIANKNRHSNRDDDVCGIEYPSVERADMNEDEACDEAVLSNDTVNKVAGPACPDQRETNKCVTAEPRAPGQIGQ